MIQLVQYKQVQTCQTVVVRTLRLKHLVLSANSGTGLTNPLREPTSLRRADIYPAVGRYAGGTPGPRDCNIAPTAELGTGTWIAAGVNLYNWRQRGAILRNSGHAAYRNHAMCV